jgi:protein SCO1/2
LGALFATALTAMPANLARAADGGQAEEGGRMEAAPKALEDVGVEEHLGQSVPLNLRFTESRDAADGSGAPVGQAVALHEVFGGLRPTLLTLNYSDCPMLCSLQLDGLVEGLRHVGLVAGKDFDIVTVSINPNERPERTQTARKKYRAALLDGADSPHKADGWRFLTGDAANVEALARAVGFRYAYVPEQKEYAHGALVTVLSPEARITRYVYGVVFEPRDLKLTLLEASEGKVGSTLDRILLYCFHYDASTGKYAPMASNIMRLGGAVTAALLGGSLLLAWQRDRNGRRERPAAKRTDEA